MSKTYNLNGPGSRVYEGSTDLSHNSVHVGGSPVFADLRKAICCDGVVESERIKLLAHVEEMEATHGTPSFIEPYNAFITTAANHMTILAPFVPQLTQLLVGLTGS